MLLGLWLDQLHADPQILLTGGINILFHGKADQDVVVVNSYRVLGVLVRQKDTSLRVFEICSLVAGLNHRISVDVGYLLLVLWLTEEHFHLVRGVAELEDDGVLLLGAMVRMEQLFTKVFECL